MYKEKSEIKDLATISLTYHQAMALRQIVFFAKKQALAAGDSVWSRNCLRHEELLDAKIEELVNDDD